MNLLDRIAAHFGYYKPEIIQAIEIPKIPTEDQMKVKVLLELMFWDNHDWGNWMDSIGLNGTAKIAISKIEISKNTVTFHTSCPGLLLGIRGETFEKLTNRISERIPGFEFKITETKLFHYV